MTRLDPLPILLAVLLTASVAHAQGQLPGTLAPAPAVIAPPPPVAPTQVPSSVGAGTVAPLTPPRSPTYGTYGGTSTLRYVYDPKPPAKKRLRFRRRHHHS